MFAIKSTPPTNFPFGLIIIRVKFFGIFFGRLCFFLSVGPENFPGFYVTNHLICKVTFSRQNSLFKNTKEKFGGKKMDLVPLQSKMHSFAM
jgi:hypothetical protein